MDANEARRIAKENNLNSAESQYRKIQEKIKKAVGRGEYNIFIYENLNKDVKNKLELDRFTIGTDQGKYNEICIRISW